MQGVSCRIVSHFRLSKSASQPRSHCKAVERLDVSARKRQTNQAGTQPSVFIRYKMVGCQQRLNMNASRTRK